MRQRRYDAHCGRSRILSANNISISKVDIVYHSIDQDTPSVDLVFIELQYDLLTRLDNGMDVTLSEKYNHIYIWIYIIYMVYCCTTIIFTKMVKVGFTLY